MLHSTSLVNLPESFLSGEKLLSAISVSVELHSNPLRADLTHVLVSFTLDSMSLALESSTDIILSFHQLIYTTLRSLLTSSAPPVPFAHIASQYSVSTSHCYPHTLLLLYAKRFILSNWSGLEVPSPSSASTHCSLSSSDDLYFLCQYPTSAQRHDSPLFPDPAMGETERPVDIEILDDSSIAFQRFLNGFRYHHSSLLAAAAAAAAAADTKASESDLPASPPADLTTDTKENEAVLIPLVPLKTLIEYIHQFGVTTPPPNASSPPPGSSWNSTLPHYSFGYHGTNFTPNVQSILSQGFNPLLRNAQLFGPGEYFTRAGYEDCAAIYSGKTNLLVLSAVMLSEELYPPAPPPPLLPLPSLSHSLSHSSTNSTPPPSPRSRVIPRSAPSPYYVIPNPNPKAYGVTGRYQFTHDYFTYCMPLLIVHWRREKRGGGGGGGEGEAETLGRQTSLGSDGNEEWIFDYNHHKDPKDLLESAPSLQSVSGRSPSGGGGGGGGRDSESGIWTAKSYLTEEESQQYDDRVEGDGEGEGERDSPPPDTSSLGISLPPPAATARGVSGQKRVITASDSYQFNDSDDEAEGEEGEDKMSESQASPNSFMKPPRPPRPLGSTNSSTVGPGGGGGSRYSRSYSTQEDDEDDERKYALRKLKSLVKHQESFLEEGGAGDAKLALEKGHSNAWFDSIF
jgi:hypothetical protein